MKYQLVVRLEFAALDDVAVCSMLDIDSIRAVVAEAEWAIRLPTFRAVTGSAKLQRVYDDKPPRLLAKWPEE